MAIKWIRIDDRLIHGQVATSWLSHVGAEQIICISDAAVENPVQTKMLKMAAPAYLVHVFGVDKFIRVYQKNPINRSTFLIMGSFTDALRLKKGGVDIGHINFGGMRTTPERTISYDHIICFSPQEEEDFNELVKMGVKVEYQVAAYDAPVDMKKKIEQLKG